MKKKGREDKEVGRVRRRRTTKGTFRIMGKKSWKNDQSKRR